MEWSPIFSGLVGAIAAAVLGYLTIRSHAHAVKDEDGWKSLRPSFMVHFAFFGSFAFSSLMAWIYLFVGSSRPDAARQELLMLLLGGAFGAGALWTLWSYYLMTVRWKGSKLQFGRFGRIQEKRVQEIATKRYVAWRSEYSVEFDDGARLIFSPYQKGGLELARKLHLPEP
jgi:hypothetical protein